MYSLYNIYNVDMMNDIRSFKFLMENEPKFEHFMNKSKHYRPLIPN